MPSRSESIGRPSYRNAVLTVIAVLLGVLAFRGAGVVPAAPWSSASAAGDAPGLPNAAEQRKRMIESLGRVEGRLTAIERRLGQDLSVRVVEMPEVRVKE